jgi:hypothetical protein
MLYFTTGGIALDPSHFKSANATAKLEADLLHKACVDVGEWVGTLQPDLIVLSTPHGIADLNNFAFYLNSIVRLAAVDDIRDFCTCAIKIASLGHFLSWGVGFLNFACESEASTCVHCF